MKPIDELTKLETDQEITIIDEHNNSYTGEFIWDSQEEVHKIDEYKIVAHYEDEKVYIVKPIDDDKLDGFLAEIRKIRTKEL